MSTSINLTKNFGHNLSQIIAIIDSGVEDYQHLIRGVVPEVKIAVLDGNEDGIRQITQILRNSPPQSEVHIISHGSPGCLKLGKTQLSLDTLQLYANELQTWSANSLILYGCNVAATDAGIEFLQKLHQLTGAEIAASTTPTGHAALGGDWNLEVQTREFDVALALSEDTRATYRFVFPEGITNLTTVEQPAQASTNTGVDVNGNPLTLNFGQGNNLVLTGFTDFTANQFLAGDLLDNFVLRRVDNTEVQGERQIVWFEGASEEPGVLNLNPSFPTSSALMEDALFGDIINRGTDNIFANTGNNDYNNNNIERVDYISTGGLAVPDTDLTGLGFIILERGGNDPFQIAAITGVDANGDPSAFGNLVAVSDNQWGKLTPE